MTDKRRNGREHQPRLFIFSAVMRSMRHAFAPFSVTLSKALAGGPKTAFVHASWILV